MTQIIVCVETNAKANTDWIYVKEAINRFYHIDNSIKLKAVYMGSKQKYRSAGVLRQISAACKLNSGTNVVIYVIDTDNIESNQTQLKEFEDIKNYCRDEGYEFVFMCRCSEEVFLGKLVEDKEKTATANRFMMRREICSIEENKLNCEHLKRGTSNLLSVLDKYLERNEKS